MNNIYSLGRRTDLIFASYSGEVLDRGDYFVIKTPSNPGYHWGNYIIFKSSPKSGDLEKWKKIFDKEFPYYKTKHHYTFTWDMKENIPGEYEEFVEDGFEFDSGVVLTASQLKNPKYFNNQLEFKIIKTQEEWKQVVDLQCLCADPKYYNDYYIDFKIAQFEQYRKLSEDGRGHWFAAYLNNKMVGDLGVFTDNEIARYQSVGTHPDFRRKGVCGSLVYFAGNFIKKHFPVETLVMEADPDYHAARIYESVGFERKETNYSLSWWVRS